MPHFPNELTPEQKAELDEWLLDPTMPAHFRTALAGNAKVYAVLEAVHNIRKACDGHRAFVKKYLADKNGGAL
jgi:hypothetical protein